MALTRFKRILTWARLYVRSMTHTFHLPPAHAEMYEGPHSDWLRNVLERLPNIQSLIVNGLPFFDHAALLTLRHQSNISKPPRLMNAPPTFTTLRFIDAQRCSNATPSGLAEALKHFPGLIYLDLSYTVAAKDSGVLGVIGSLPNLQILKLNNIGLKDEEVKVLTSKLGLRIRSLDLRNNGLTDISIRLLLETCFKTVQSFWSNKESSFTETGSWPSRLDSAYVGDILRHVQDNELDQYLRKRLTSELVDRLAIEDTQAGGITHFYISGNRVTAEGILAILRSANLSVLDAGDVARELPKMSLLDPPPEYGSWESFALPGVEKLIPIVAAASGDLTYLRINHAILTECAPAHCTAPPPLPEMVAELPAQVYAAAPATSLIPERSGIKISRGGFEDNAKRAELDRRTRMAELDNTSVIPELSSDTVTISERFELPGDGIGIPTSFELPGYFSSSSRIFELVGSTPLVSDSIAEGNANSERSEWSFNSASSDRLIISSVDDDDDNQTSVILNASGKGLTADAAAMNGISSVARRQLPPLVDGQLLYAAPDTEQSWDSTVTEKITVLRYGKDKSAIPNQFDTTDSTEPIPKNNNDTLVSTNHACFPSTRSISPVDYKLRSDPSHIMQETGGSQGFSTTPNNDTLRISQTRSISPTLPRQISTDSPSQSPPEPSYHTHRTYSSVVAERRARLENDITNPSILRPSMLPHLRTLILTSLPSHCATTTPIDRITSFLTACAEESHLARQQAQYGYAMPPGQHGRLQAQREYARSIFALERIVLEIVPPVSLERGAGKRKASWRKYPTKSSTEDADSESFWEAAQYDFSFFGDEECGQPVGQLASARKSFGASAGMMGTGLMVVGDEEGRVERERVGSEAGRGREWEQTTLEYDLVAEISKFRKEAKGRYERVAREAAIETVRGSRSHGGGRWVDGKGKGVGSGSDSGRGGGGGVGLGEIPFVPGYWEGEVTVVRLLG